jgi:2-polyprenyl-6-methoxyphenol hydroxylase-like FAD-dependent oxidoreductase
MEEADMRIAVAGGGPVGIFAAMSLARRGHQVTLVDRDPGPGADGSWRRAGVMQFLHPHGFRAQVRHALLAELPDVHDALLANGAEVRAVPGAPAEMAGLWCRRSVFERTLRAAAAREPRLRWVVGHVDRLMTERGTARGLVVDGAPLEADLVIVATGRSSHLGDELRGPVEGGPCGFSYVSRMYRALPGRPGCDLLGPAYATGPDYYSLVLPQDAGTHSVLFCYPSHAAEFAMLRTADGFARASAAVPNLAPWTDQDRFEPITAPLVGGNLTNTYRLQGRELGAPPATGLLFVGDAVATFNPYAGRYLGLALPHVRQLLAVLDDLAADLADASTALDLWAEQHIRPWFADHVYWDRTLLDRFGGGELDLGAPLPSDVVCAAAAVDPSIAPFAGMYLGMIAGPDVLDPARESALALLRSGWRPTSEGPRAAELRALADDASDAGWPAVAGAAVRQIR